MARTEENEKHVWGTWEELLLASAVNRHGSKNWDSIAMEVQNRCSSPHLLLTPHNCKQKYRDLHRRFTEQGLVKNKDETTGNDDDDDDDGKIPWLEELRKLRVIELRRQVQRSDTSIVSLQLKVKRLKEEREQSMRESENAELKSDPERNTVEENQKRDLDEQVRSPSTIGKPVSGENSDRDNESISTGPKAGRDEAEKKPEPVKVNDEKLDPVAADADSAGDKPAGESSCNGSSETIGQKSGVNKSVEAVPNREADESAEVWESGTEFKERGESTAKESSDVQSSTSLSRKNQRQKVVSGSSSGGEEPEVSPRKSGESEPLKRFLEIIISHKYGPIFERRLDSQETNKYKGLIRQHLDLEIVHTRLKEGYYSGCNSKFFRDLLLLFNNALVFFPKNSPEFIAAHELRQLSSKEMAVHFLKSNQRPTKPKPSNKPKPLSSILKSDPEPLDSLLVKPKSSGGSLVVCKKRSSITAKAASSVGEKKAEPKTAVVEEKKPATSDKKEAADTLLVIEQQSVINKRKRDKSRSSRQINKNQNASTTASNNNKNSNLGSNQISNPPLNPMTEGKGVTVIAAPPPAADVEDDNSELKSDKEKKSITTVAKKRSVANFLNRMKRNSSSNGTLLETLKNTPENANNVKGADSNPGKGGGTKEQKKSSGTTTEQKKGNGTTTTEQKKGGSGTTTTTEQKKGGSGTTTTTDQKKGGSGTTTTTDQKKSGGGTTTAEQKKSGGGTTTEQKKSGGTTAEQKKGSGPSEAKKSSAKNDDKKGNGSRNTTSGKHAQEQRNSSSPGKRSVGRPASKRKAATSPVPSPPVSSKRTREKEKVEVEAAAASKQPRKRTRR